MHTIKDFYFFILFIRWKMWLKVDDSVFENFRKSEVQVTTSGFELQIFCIAKKLKTNLKISMILYIQKEKMPRKMH